MKYNIALVPEQAGLAQNLINLAHDISLKNGLLPEYLLKNREHTSIPHLSVIQFEVAEDANILQFFSTDTDREELLSTVWGIAEEVWQELIRDYKEIFCQLLPTINYKHDQQGTFKGISWLELIVDKDKNFLIQKFHETLREKLLVLNIHAKNANGKNYNPHFTLFNIATEIIKSAPLIDQIPDKYCSLLKPFSVIPVLGLANDCWELTIKKYSLKKIFKLEKTLKL